MMSAIESEDDLWVWVEYIAESVAIQGGIMTLAYFNPNQSAVPEALPLSSIMASAYADKKVEVKLGRM